MVFGKHLLQDSSLPNGQIDAWTSTPYTLVDVLSISTRYEMAANSITTCHPQIMNCKRTYEPSLSTLYVFNCLTLLFMWKLLQKRGKERERAEKDRQEAEQVRQELQKSCRMGTSMAAMFSTVTFPWIFPWLQFQPRESLQSCTPGGGNMLFVTQIHGLSKYELVMGCRK